MRILGIDTSSKVLSIAISKEDRTIAEESQVVDRRHSSVLVPKIKQLLDEADLSIDDIDVFVVGLGPGSFTGLRIGVSAVKGFGIATGKPCIGIPSIDAIAMNVEEDAKAESIVPIIDAKRSQVYCAVYKKDKERIIRKSKHLLLTVECLMKRVSGTVFLSGDGIGLYKEKIQHINKKAVFLDEEYWYPRASNLIKLAFGKIKRRHKGDLRKLVPIYLYPKDCQVRVAR